MFKKRFIRQIIHASGARVATLACALAGLSAAPSFADDIDIICSTETYAEPILFLLDDSGSMSDNKLSGNQGITREEALKQVFREYMLNREGGEVGMMLFRNDRKGKKDLGGGFVAYPVADITTPPYTAPERQGPARTTVRDELIYQIEQNVGGGGTPIMDVLYESVLYLMGDKVDFGRDRQGLANDRLSHPASYENGVSSQPNCWDSGNKKCADEVINGNANYISPFAADGGDSIVNIVLLSDGQPTVHKSKAKIAALIGESNCASDAVEDSEKCGRSLAQWLAGRDLLPDVPGKQEVVIHTVAFDLDSDSGRIFLKDLAAPSGGQALTANKMHELSIAFGSITTGPTGPAEGNVHSFTRAALSIDPIDRTKHSDDIYFTVFGVGGDGPWRGNLKKYQLSGEPKQVVDASGRPAFDSATGNFSEGTRSLWSSEDDGDQAHLGGAAEQLPAPAARNIYTDVATTFPVNLMANLNALATANSEAIGELMGDDISGEAAESIIAWARGETEANVIGDPLHSNPVVVTYSYDPAGQNDAEKVAFFGTNQGYLHAVDTDSGEEIFAFMPRELLANLPLYAAGSATIGDKRIYGLDGSPVVWVQNSAPFESISGSDQVMVYIGMRRGGSNYYALDVTNPHQPQLKWKITGGVANTDFANLGQTWSTPVKTQVRIADGSEQGELKDVLIFGGGFDPKQDTVTTRTEDTVGNAIYMVDADSGDLIWMASKTVSGNNGLPLSEMRYSIPSDLTVVDLDQNGQVDSIIVGDMGGQVWRLDIQQNQSPQNLVRGGVIARMSGSGESDHRRFFNAPDVALVNHDNRLRLSIAIGSGNRTSPLDTTVADRFYVFFVDDPFGLSQAPYTTQTEANWTDRTNTTVGSSTDGWYIGFDAGSGEKVLASSVTLNNTIVFTTFTPNIEGGAPVCTAVGTMGSNRLWALNVNDSAGSIDLNGDGQVNANSDRVVDLHGTSIMPQPQLVLSEKSISIISGPEPLAPHVKAIFPGNQAEPFFYQEIIE
jgi:type IV pilus assembly protein PilY1